MKSPLQKVFAALVVLTTALVLNAQALATSSELPSSLSLTMKRMSSDLKKVTSQVNNPALNAESEALSNDFVTMAIHAKNFTPDKIAALPVDLQSSAKSEYDLSLDKTAQNGQLLAQAFRDNDNAKAVEILSLLSQDKKEGHKKFKE